MKISNTTSTAKTKLLQDEKPSKTAKPESESSESEGETDESESDDEETKGSDTSNEENKVMAPIEVKAEFLQCVMSGNYEKAQEICKQSKYHYLWLWFGNQCSKQPRFDIKQKVCSHD